LNLTNIQHREDEILRCQKNKIKFTW